MPRRLRLVVPGYPLHIVQRGHNRSACFFSDADRVMYLDLVYEALQKTQCSLHAYVLMTNHVHLLLSPPDVASLISFAMHVNRYYVQRINKKYRRSGTLWESRYRSSLVSTDSHLFATHRYIELNPVRAALVSCPAHYRWSSYAGNALAQADRLLTTHPLVESLSDDVTARASVYRAMFETGQTAEEVQKIRDALNNSLPLGDDVFISRLERESGLVCRRGKVGRPGK